MDRFAYSAANTFPLKVLLHEELRNNIRLYKKVIPVHLQLNPTNKCNFSCPECSCSSRDKKLEMGIEEILLFCLSAQRLGAKSITVTGGGEPTLHKDFEELITKLKKMQFQLGLVTNGTIMKNNPKLFNLFTWVRISATDNLGKNLYRLDKTVDSWLDDIALADERSLTDWAFSYVTGEQTNYPQIMKLIKFALEHDFTHVRLVNNILKSDPFLVRGKMESIAAFLQAHKVSDDLVNYQSRSSWTTGQNPCYISLLKPLIGADGYLYPCCGTQYALKIPSRDYEKTMRMGKATDLPELIERQSFFNGTICSKCYYENYNIVLNRLMNGMPHEQFL